MEKKGHDSRLSSLQKVAAALGLPEKGIHRFVDDFFSLDPNSIRATSLNIREQGFDSWPLHLMNFVDAFRASSNLDWIAVAPSEHLDAQLSAILTSTVETLCAELRLPIPEWCAGIGSLNEPWFVSGIENLKASALVESPVYFRRRNIFVLSNFLDRV